MTSDYTVRLPTDLLCRIFAGLPFQAKLLCQSVCKRWAQLLVHPVTPGIWGTLDLDIASIAQRLKLSLPGPAIDARGQNTARTLSRWLVARSQSGIVGVNLSLYEDEGDYIEPPTLVDFILPALAGCLQHHPERILPLQLVLEGQDVTRWAPALFNTLVTARLRPYVRELFLISPGPISDQDWQAICNLEQLTTLQLTPKHQDDSVDLYGGITSLSHHISQLGHLQRLSLTAGHRPSMHVSPQITQLQQLTALELCGASDCLALLTSLTSLRLLAMVGAHAPSIQTMPAASELQGLSQLISLAMRGIELAGCHNLQAVSLLPQLQQLALHDVTVPGAGQQHSLLACPPSLTLLHLNRGNHMIDLVGLAQLPQLAFLKLSACRLNSFNVPAVHHPFSSLLHLDLSSNALPSMPFGLEHLTRMTELVVANQQTPFFLTAEMAFVATCQELRRMDINQGYEYGWDPVSLMYIASAEELAVVSRSNAGQKQLEICALVDDSS